MKLLIVCQALDKKHPILGFFHRWVEEFAKHATSIVVIASHVGECDLPQNVSVHSLGKEKGTSKLYKITKLIQLSWKLRKEYDAVFVHMIPEFVLTAGWLWRSLGKEIGLWYMHKTVDLKLRLAEKFIHQAFTATKESFRLPSKKLNILGHGINTSVFIPDTQMSRGQHLLSVGRLMKSKRHDLVIRVAAKSNCELHIAGTGDEKESLEQLAQELGVNVRFLGGLTQEELVEVYRQAYTFVHTSETGSLDKVVLEALACGCPVVTSDVHLKDMPVVVSDATPEALSEAISSQTSGDPQKRHQYVVENHSLEKLIPRILSFYD